MKNVGEPVPRRLTVQYALLRIVGINFSNLINFEQTAICLLGILPVTLAICLRPEGGDIVTCRVAPMSQDHNTKPSIVGVSRTPWFVPIASALLWQNGRRLTGWSGREESCS